MLSDFLMMFKRRPMTVGPIAMAAGWFFIDLGLGGTADLEHISAHTEVFYALLAFSVFGMLKDSVDRITTAKFGTVPEEKLSDAAEAEYQKMIVRRMGGADE